MAHKYGDKIVIPYYRNVGKCYSYSILKQYHPQQKPVYHH